MPAKKKNLAAFLDRQAPSPVAAPTAPAASTKGEKRVTAQFLVRIAPEGIEAVKIAGVQGRRSASAIVAEALNDWFRKNGLPPVA
jgi:hypothetical protein